MELPLLNVVSGEKPREIAARVLQRRNARGAVFVENLLEQALEETLLSPLDRGLCQELVFGVIRWQMTLDWLIARKTAARNQKPMLQNLLRLGLYQIFFLDRIPNHAAVHETVEQAKRAGFGQQAGFVNAILRGCLREFDTTIQTLAELKTTQPHIGYSHPEWLVQRWQKRLGVERAAALMEWNNTPPKIFARVNSLKTDAGKLLAAWRNENVGYDFVHHDWLQENLLFELKSHPPLSELDSFKSGAFYVQDPSTLVAVNELNPQPGETILDLCAAPGGKTTYVAQFIRNEGRVIAHDVSAERMKLLKENCARLGADCVEVVSPDALESQPAPFDRILVDAPCSNTGVMRRRVDLRWRIRPEELPRLQTQQLELLRFAALRLKPGGTLVYSTCSLALEENQHVVERFLEEFPVFKLDRERELLPPVDKVDGAFVARLVRG